MSKVARKLLTPAVAALSLGLLAQQASATEEMVVYGSTSTFGIRVEQQVFRAEIDDYIRALNTELRATLDRDFEDLKRTLAPKLEIAVSETPARG